MRKKEGESFREQKGHLLSRKACGLTAEEKILEESQRIQGTWASKSCEGGQRMEEQKNTTPNKQ